MHKLYFNLATVLLCFVGFATAQVVPNAEIGRVTLQVPLLSNGKPVSISDQVEIAHVKEVKAGHKVVVDAVVVPPTIKQPSKKETVLVRNMRAIVETTNPGIPNHGIPNPGIPNRGLPNPGIPNDGLPNPGIPNHGIPNPGIPNRGLPNPGIPNDGLPNPGIPNHGITNPGIPNRGLPNPGIPNDGLPNPGIPNHGIPNPGIPNRGLPNPGIPNDGLPNPGIPNHGIPNPGIPNRGLPNPGIPNDGLPNPGIPNHGIPNPGIPNKGLPNAGIPHATAASELNAVVVTPPNTIAPTVPAVVVPKRVPTKQCHQLLLGGSSTPSSMLEKPQPVKNCDMLCTKLEFIPICAFNGVCVHEFANQCLLDTFNCKNRDAAFHAVDEDICRLGLCMRRCTERDLMK